jgi:hypothetical protein
MNSNTGGSNVILGVLLGAVIVLAVGGGILYATGNIGRESTTVTVQQPAAVAPPKTTDDKTTDDSRDRRDGRWDGRRDDDRREGRRNDDGERRSN